ncbi:Hint domain-containing protein [Chitinophaga solisilvae]|uniref:Hint domain-containing protein n=1 Tax=Chitinophaga solisilvae TaxID=1233460 RepID=UPI00136E198F|nr:Hint domain-containing protein [Chitinophaga solisilvae]
MSWYETCKTEVARMNPPGTMCDYNRCLRIQRQIDNTCHGRKWTPGQPYILDNPDGSVCYCCCSCFQENTPIAVSMNEFRLIQDFRKGDPVFAANSKLEWSPTTVDFCTNVEGTQSESFMVNVKWGSNPDQQITVTEDHLFLIPGPSGNVLVPAGALNTNDKLIQANGEHVKVTRVVSGMQRGGVYTISTTAPFNSMDGHLLNSNGVISADFALQAGYIGGQLDSGLLVADLDQRHHVSSAEYQELYHTEETREFLADPDVWPAGFTVNLRQNLYVIPPDARSFMTDDQARDILSNPEAPKRPFSNNYAVAMAEYLWTLFGAFYGEINYVMDWNNEVPNAYAFDSYGQKYILLTGGLLRQSSLDKEGLSLVVSQALAYLNAAGNNRPVLCAGVADYDSFLYLGNVYRDNNYITTYRNGYNQVEKLWSFIREPYRGGTDKCFNPGIDCRLATYKAAAALDPLPPCANPDYVPFTVTSATSKKGDGTVIVTFNQPVNEYTALSVINYSITPFTEILGVTMKKGSNKVVVLQAAIFEDTAYVLGVGNIISAAGYLLDPNPAFLPLVLTK